MKDLLKEAKGDASATRDYLKELKRALQAAGDGIDLIQVTFGGISECY